MNRTIINKARNRRGFTVLLAVLVASLLLLLGASTFGIVSKEIVLSSTGRDSQFAFYAADAGAECALFWDFRHNAFEEGISISCNGVSLGVIPFEGTGQEMNFEYETGNFCTKVTVIKNSSVPRTTIQSRGYNTACESISTNPRALERAVELTY